MPGSEPRNESRRAFLPTATAEALRRRAALLEKTRLFFARRGVLEVDTPLLGAEVAVEGHIDPIVCEHPRAARSSEVSPKGADHLYLRTSPEAAMKRLLAAGSGSIYQITHAFRGGERGRLHNPEFTILEWYRPGLDYHGLMDEVADLMGHLLGIAHFEKLAYRDAFRETLELDPLTCPVADLIGAARERGVGSPLRPGEDVEGDRDTWLNLLLASCVEPNLGKGTPTFLYDYPATQAALARVRPGEPPVAERFELYIRGVEICNGYQELVDAAEQARRFAAANRQRSAAGKPRLPVDGALVEALESGLPPCSGVAVGFDRVVLLDCGAESIDEVIAFPFERA